MVRRAPLLMLVACLFAATVAMVVAASARAELRRVEAALDATDGQVVTVAEVLAVERPYGLRAATVRYLPPVGRAAMRDGTPVPTVERAYLGGLSAHEGGRLEVAPSTEGHPPIADARAATAAARRIAAVARALEAPGLTGYLAAVALLVHVVRRWDGPAVRADTATRHGG